MVQACRVFARHKSLSPPSDKRRLFSVDCVSWFLVTWSRRCWLNSKLGKTIKVHRQARLKTCLTYIITSVWKFSAYCNNLGTLSSSEEKNIWTPRKKHWNRYSLLSRHQLHSEQSLQPRIAPLPFFQTSRWVGTMFSWGSFTTLLRQKAYIQHNQ